MANSIDYRKISVNTEFKRRTIISLLVVAYDVKAELDSVDYSALRKAFANSLIQNVDNYIKRTCQNLAAQNGIFQNMHVDENNTSLIYDGSKTPSAWWDGIDQTIKEQIENIYNDLAGIIEPVP